MSKENQRDGQPSLLERLRVASGFYDQEPPDPPEDMLEEFQRDLEREEEVQEGIRRDVEAAVCAEMIPLIPEKLNDPGSIAAGSLAVFDLYLHSHRQDEYAKHLDTNLQNDMDVLAKALRRFKKDIEHHSELGLLLLSNEAWRRGVDLSGLFDQLQVLEKIAVEFDIENAAGRPKDVNTTAALAAAQYLMDRGIKRQRAAKIVAVLTLHHPDVDSKDWRTIQDAMIAAGITSRVKKLGKGGWGGGRLLTPG